MDDAGRALGELVQGWGYDPTVTTVSTVQTRDGTRVVDPIALSALILSLPSAVLSVVDLADRIHKRRRAQDLIIRARQLAEQNIIVEIVTCDRPTELPALDPDQLLDLIAQDATTE